MEAPSAPPRPTPSSSNPVLQQHCCPSCSVSFCSSADLLAHLEQKCGAGTFAGPKSPRGPVSMSAPVLGNNVLPAPQLPTQVVALPSQQQQHQQQLQQQQEEEDATPIFDGSQSKLFAWLLGQMHLFALVAVIVSLFSLVSGVSVLSLFCLLAALLVLVSRSSPKLSVSLEALLETDEAGYCGLNDALQAVFGVGNAVLAWLNDAVYLVDLRKAIIAASLALVCTHF